MKKTHDHTQLKRLAAISLVVVMCLSALPMLAPPANAATIPSADIGRGYVCLTFDDIPYSVYDITYPALSAAGITATAFCTTDRLSDPNYLGADELLELQAAGWEIGSHGVTHTKFTEMTEEQMDYEFSESKRILTDIGLQIDTFAYPHAVSNVQSLDIGARYYERQRVGGLSNLYLNDYPSSVTETGSIADASVGTWENLKKYIDDAIHTGGVVVIYYHGAYQDGRIWNTEYTVYDLADYLVEMRDKYGLRTINYRDLPNAHPDADTYLWDGEGADDKASTAENWRKISASGVVTNDVLPTDGSNLLWNSTSSTNCIFDLDIAANSWRIGRGYAGNIYQGDFDIRIGKGGLIAEENSVPRYAILYGTPERSVICQGGVATYLNMVTVNLVMEGNGVILVTRVLPATLDIRGVVYQYPQQGRMSGALNKLIVRNDAILDTIRSDIYFNQKASIEINGSLTGTGRLTIHSNNEDSSYDLTNVGLSEIIVRKLAGGASNTVTISGLDFTGTFRTENLDASRTVTIACDGPLRAGRIALAAGTALVGGNSIITTDSWDSYNGTWTPEQSTVILRDGGSAVLAPGQSFNRLEVASEDGRTASWTMTAAGAQAPIVTGLKSGSYLWYLDGVEQGEVKADEHGTIALSYESTFRHELSVGPAPMTVAMDGMAAAVGIVAVLAVLGGLITMVGRIKF